MLFPILGISNLLVVVAQPNERHAKKRFQTIGGDRNVGPLGVVVSQFRPTFRIEGRGPHHHVEAARCWCSMQDKTEGEFFMQNLRTPSTGSDSPPPWLSRIRASPARHLRHHSIFDLWSRPWGVARLLGVRGVPPRPHPSEGVGSHQHHHQRHANRTASVLEWHDRHRGYNIWFK